MCDNVQLSSQLLTSRSVNSTHLIKSCPFLELTQHTITLSVCISFHFQEFDNILYITYIHILYEYIYRYVNVYIYLEAPGVLSCQ